MKKTEEITKERTEEYTEEVEYWICDSCKCETSEEEAVPVAIAPSTRARRGPLGARSSDRLKNHLANYAADVHDCSDFYHNENRPRHRTKSSLHHYIEKYSAKIEDDIIPLRESGIETTSAASVDMCPECVEDTFGIELEEHDGEVFDERNVSVSEERVSIWPSLPPLTYDTPGLAFLLGMIPLAGIIWAMFDWDLGNTGDVVVAVLAQAVSFLLLCGILFLYFL